MVRTFYRVFITYGDTVAPGGIKFALLVVDQKTRYNFLLPLKDCKGTSLIDALQKLKIMAGKLPRIIYTNFDPKILSKNVANWYHKNDGIILAAEACLISFRLNITINTLRRTNWYSRTNLIIDNSNYYYIGIIPYSNQNNRYHYRYRN